MGKCIPLRDPDPNQASPQDRASQIYVPRNYKIRSPYRAIEIVTTGVDEALQGIGGDPYQHMEGPGLRIPAQATSTMGTGGVSNPGPVDSITKQALFNTPLLSRYLFLLATFKVSLGGFAHIRGWRQLLTLGLKQGGAGSFRPVEQIVSSPFFKFVDGNVSWHFMEVKMPPDLSYTQGPNDLDNFTFRMGMGPALLYEAATLPPLDPFYVDLTAYLPPNGGRPWGIPLVPGFGSMYDQRVQWNVGDTPSWQSLDIWLDGPRHVAFFASVRQTNTSRTALTPPGALNPAGLSSEEQFLLNFPTAQYWRLGVSLAVEFDGDISINGQEYSESR